MNLNKSTNRIQIKYHLINSELGTIFVTPYEWKRKDFFRYMNKYNENTRNYSVFSEVISTKTATIDRTQDYIKG